ncbi:MAG: 2-C-methyl-D-erythritol 4-phosphate cytidylyltransferase [Bacteroidota bacterium]|nr:2-C-methyl-D-erythritol 4-phosphate cytidylyltransferase [Bacteroidota bacterium]
MNPPPFVVCVPAAGGGKRFGGALPKQFIEIRGVPVLALTLSVFQGIPECTRIILAVNDRKRVENIIRRYALTKVDAIVNGGPRRQDSAAAMLPLCGDDETVVLFHDAVRPCVNPAHVRAVARAVQEVGAALLALHARDTIKRAQGGRVLTTLDRSEIWLAQTPQGARAGLWRKAFDTAERDGYCGTDDVELLERLGIEVALVPGDAANIKITTPEDIALVDAVLGQRQRATETPGK